MRVAVVSISLDEEKHVERWAESAKDADVLIIGDTGSTDGTVDIAGGLGVTVHRIAVKPFRFDVARNALLALIPTDVDTVINLDLDEVMVEGWREQLEAAPEAERYSYHYVWSWTADGQPDMNFRADKCHSRNGWLWRHPCHESLYRSDGGSQAITDGGFAIHHHPDGEKSRGSYLDLLAVAVREDPQDARMAHYYARELFFRGQWDDARREFMRHLQMPTATWRAERAQSMRYIAKMDYYPERWLWSAVAEDMTRRDALVDLVDLYVKQDMRLEAAGLASRALQIQKNPGDYITTRHAYDDTYLRDVIRGASNKDRRGIPQPDVRVMTAQGKR